MTFILAVTTVALDIVSGKKLAILGARGVGKTHLLTFLTTGSIPESYKHRRESKGRRSLSLKIGDLPGGPETYAEWKEIFGEAYLIDKLMEHDAEAENRVRRDMRRWLKDRRPPFFIIGTHGDLANPEVSRQ